MQLLHVVGRVREHEEAGVAVARCRLETSTALEPGLRDGARELERVIMKNDDATNHHRGGVDKSIVPPFAQYCYQT